jgi:hypothetical protein
MFGFAQEAIQYISTLATVADEELAAKKDLEPIWCVSFIL